MSYMNELSAINKQSTESRENPWEGFTEGPWQSAIDTKDFIARNIHPWTGDDSFLVDATNKTKRLMVKVEKVLHAERAVGGVLGASLEPSAILSHAPGFIDRENEIIFGLQTEAPLKRGIHPRGGLRVVKQALHEHGMEPLSAPVEKAFSSWAKTHNQAVFDAYPADVLAARKAMIITGLPDAYGRGRLIGDFRRVALYGVDVLKRAKMADKAALGAKDELSAEDIEALGELGEQIHALGELKSLGQSHGFDLSRPANNAREAFQWLYLAYLAAAKQSDGAATSIGRIGGFLDIYIERDMERGLLDEAGAQELWDQLTIKLRLIRFMRTKAFDELFSGDPTWVTISLGGMGQDGRPMCSKSDFRVLHCLSTLGPSPEPNLTVLWSQSLPDGFKKFVTKMSIASRAIQVENDDLIRPEHGSDAAISCCVSPMAVGKSMQYFGARCNLLKTLLHAINGGRDEVSGEMCAPGFEPITGDYLDFDDVKARFETMMARTAKVYMKALNIIHQSHDLHAYEAIQFALHDTDLHRTMACGIAGLSHVADSLSAIKYGKVRVVRDETGLITGYVNEGGAFPRYGNNDARVDDLAVWAAQRFMSELRKLKARRNAVVTQSALTITSNVVYGQHTGASPDGRKGGKPFAPGANPSNGAELNGFVAAGASVAKIPFSDCADGISWTVSFAPSSLGRTPEERVDNLASFCDGYMSMGGYHANLNVIDRATLIDADKHPEKYPNLCVRVSGYCVLFYRLTPAQRQDVISRTFHAR